MTWFGGEISFGSLTAKVTASQLAALAEHAMSGASERVCELGASTGIEPHVTLLYHGHKGCKDALEALARQFDLQNKVFLGEVGRVYPVKVPEHGVFCLALEVHCEPLQRFYAQFRAAVEEATQQESKQHPHLDENGKSVYLNDFHPHITLAKWKTATEMDAELETATAFAEVFRCEKLMINGFRLFD